MTKPNYIQQIKDIVDGVGDGKKWKKTYYMSPRKESKKYTLKEGEIWVDNDGKRWTRKNGTITSIRKSNLSMNPFWKCSECGKIITSKLDKKMVRKTGKCLDCIQSYEDKLKLEGKYKLYERKKMQANLKSWLIDHKQQVEEGLKNVNSKIEHVLNSSGKILNFDIPESAINKIIKNYKTELILIDKTLKYIEKKEEEMNNNVRTKN